MHAVADKLGTGIPGYLVLEEAKILASLSAARSLGRAEFEDVGRVVAADSGEIYQSPTIASSWIPPLLALWATLAPDMVVEEREVELGTWQESQRSGAAQLAVVHCAGDVEGFESYTIGSDDLVVVTSESVSDLLPLGPVDLRLLAGSRLLIWQRAQAPAYYDLVVGAFRDAGLDPVVDTRLRRATTRVAEIASGETVAVLPSQAAAFPQPGVRYRAIQGGPTASVDVVWQAAESRREVLAALDVVRLNVVDVA